MTAHYILQTTHIGGDEYLEEQIPLRATNLAAAQKEFMRYAKKRGFDEWMFDGTAYHYVVQSVNRKNSLRLR